MGGADAQGGAQAPKTNPKATLTATTEAPQEYLNWTWSDAGGNDGKGGVKVISKPGNKTLPLRDSDFNRKLHGDPSVENHAGWLLFYGSGSKSLSFEWERVTREDEKFWAIGWGAAGMAFNQSWAAIDASK
ncbi:MAG TPA: hypothetical protein VGP93_19740, partial [Polyangiaceae bacterium]|nr:hypothetical protein [Polyangiaceae bacterium]